MKLFIVDLTFQCRIPVFAQDESMAEAIACDSKNDIEWHEFDIDTCKVKEATHEEALHEFSRYARVFMADGDKLLKDIVYGYEDDQDECCMYCEELVQHCSCWREVY